MREYWNKTVITTIILAVIITSVFVFYTTSQKADAQSTTLDFTKCETLLSEDELKRISDYNIKLRVTSRALAQSANEPTFESGCTLYWEKLDGSSRVYMTFLKYSTDKQAESKWNIARESQDRLYVIQNKNEGEFFGGWEYRSIEVNDNQFSSFWISHKDTYFLYFTNKIIGNAEPLVDYDDLDDLARLVQNKIDTYESEITAASAVCDKYLSQDEFKRISDYNDRLIVTSQGWDPTNPNEPTFERGCSLYLQTLDGSSMFIMSAVTYFTDEQAENKWDRTRVNQDRSYVIQYTKEGPFFGGWEYRSIKVNNNEFPYFWISYKDTYFLYFTNKITGNAEPLADYDDLEDLARLVQNKIDDKRPPVMVVPPDMIVDATDPEGTLVEFSVTASDDVYGVLIPTCTPSSGSLFSVGYTTVTCSAIDDSGNSKEITFSVTVKPFFSPGTIAGDLDGTSVDVSYDADGVEVLSVQSDLEFISLLFQVKVTGSPGILEITLDRNFLDATLDSLDDEFLIITDGFNEPTFEEVETTSELRTLRIELVAGTEELEIFGTAFGEPEPVKEKVPGWIKNNAKWWSDGQIGDTDFLSGIQFMIKEKIINIPNLPEQASETTEEKVPDWIRNNAGWWADGQISDDDFVNGIKYLVEKGIIKI